MKILTLAVSVMMSLFICSLSHCENVDVDMLVDQYAHATDLQKQELETNFLGKPIRVSGKVENVEEYNYFDVTNDVGEKYYKVTTTQQDTEARTPYQVILIYRNKDQAVDMNRGEEIEKEAVIINLIDERLQIAVWTFVGELTDKDRQLFFNRPHSKN